jgi:hypothetical protein
MSKTDWEDFNEFLKWAQSWAKTKKHLEIHHGDNSGFFIMVGKGKPHKVWSFEERIIDCKLSWEEGLEKLYEIYQQA